MKPIADPRNACRHFQPVAMRWMDNDVYGHVNNAIYYSYFDTVVNTCLIREGVLNIGAGDTIGLVIETQGAGVRIRGRRCLSQPTQRR